MTKVTQNMKVCKVEASITNKIREFAYVQEEKQWGAQKRETNCKESAKQIKFINN